MLGKKQKISCAASLSLTCIILSACLSACLSASLSICLSILPNANSTAFAASDKDELSLSEARQYMLTLINRDRKSQGLKEVTYDDVAEKAGTEHSNEMAKLGYLSHWDMSGRKPDQRYNMAGGSGFVMENTHIQFSGFAGGNVRGTSEFKIDPDAKVAKRTIEEIEQEFFGEQPPNDGHRKNILDPDHTRVGIGLSYAVNGDSYRLACTQEFIHSYGNVDVEPQTITIGETFLVKGNLDPGLQLQSLDLFRDDLPKPMTLQDLDATHSYGPPTTRVFTHFAGSGVSRDVLTVKDVDGRQAFECKFPTEKNLWKPGLYYVYVWARVPNSNRKGNLVVASKTIEVR